MLRISTVSLCVNTAWLLFRPTFASVPEKQMICGNENSDGQNSTIDDGLMEQVLMNPDMLEEVMTNMNHFQLSNAANVCPKWKEEATLELRRRHVGCRIVHIDFSGNMRDEDRTRFENFRTRGSWWIPALVLLFKHPSRIAVPIPSEMFREAMRRSKCLMVENLRGNPNYERSYEFRIHYIRPQDCNAEVFTDGSAFSGFIFPQRLLNRPGIKVHLVMPPLILFLSQRDEFVGSKDENRLAFERLFDWKKDVPVKCALIWTRQINTGHSFRGSSEWGRQIVGKITQWLGSLEQSEHFSFDHINEYFTEPHPAANGTMKDVALVLIGGNAVQVTEVRGSSVYCWTYQEHMARLAQQFANCKRDVISKWGNETQVIALMVTDVYFHWMAQTFKDFWGDEVPLTVISSLPAENNKTMDYLEIPFEAKIFMKTKFIFIGFQL